MTFEKILELAEAARVKWVKENFDEERIERAVYQRLNRILDTAIYTFLGLEHRFGEFSVDHCNGRRTILSNRVEEVLNQHLPDLLQQHAAQFAAKLSPKQLNALKAEYQRHLDYKLHQHAIRMAEENAQRIIEGALKEALAHEDAIFARQAGGEELAKER